MSNAALFQPWRMSTVHPRRGENYVLRSQFDEAIAGSQVIVRDVRQRYRADLAAQQRRFRHRIGQHAREVEKLQRQLATAEATARKYYRIGENGERALYVCRDDFDIAILASQQVVQDMATRQLVQINALQEGFNFQNEHTERLLAEALDSLTVNAVAFDTAIEFERQANRTLRAELRRYAPEQDFHVVRDYETHIPLSNIIDCPFMK